MIWLRIPLISFHTFTTGEGGMATTNDPTWAERIRRMTLHGLSQDAWKRHSAQSNVKPKG